MTLRAVFDSNVFDEFLLDDASENNQLINEVNSCVKDGRLEVVVTHVQADELSATPNVVRRDSLMRVLQQLNVTRVPTSGAVWNVSRWNESQWGGGSGPIQVADIAKGNPKHLAMH